MNHSGRLLKALRQDGRRAWQHLYLNILAGSPFTPRVLRWVLYRLWGFKFETPNIFAKNVFTGGAEISIGQGTFLNTGSYFEAVAPITIGRNCHLAMQVLVTTSDHVLDEPGGFSRTRIGRPVSIGDDCWIGARAILLPGVSIGDRVVVAAGSVVARDCDDDGLYAGSPARRVRDLVGVADVVDGNDVT